MKNSKFKNKFQLYHFSKTSFSYMNFSCNFSSWSSTWIVISLVVIELIFPSMLCILLSKLFNKSKYFFLEKHKRKMLINWNLSFTKKIPKNNNYFEIGPLKSHHSLRIFWWRMNPMNRNKLHCYLSNSLYHPIHGP